MAAREEFTGLKERLRLRLRERGFWHAGRGVPNTSRFSRAFPDYVRQELWLWTSFSQRRRPRLPDLRRLAADLEESYTYLLLGRQVFDEPEWSRLLAARARWLEARRAAMEPSHRQPTLGEDYQEGHYLVSGAAGRVPQDVTIVN